MNSAGKEDLLGVIGDVWPKAVYNPSVVSISAKYHIVILHVWPKRLEDVL